MPQFSILICFRNRDLIRVKRCLDTIYNQSYSDYEVIFVDYGSEKEIASETERLVNTYAGFKYVYNDTRGMPWNQPHALNTALLMAKGKYIFRLDVDLMLPPSFLAKVAEIIHDDSYIHSKCFYLPENFADHNDLFTENFDHSKFVISDDTALGLLLIVSRESILSVNGFDEFYSFWGFDDLDISKRLIGIGKKIQWLYLNDLPVYHQWHPPSGQKNPTGYYEVLKQHYDNIPLNNNLNSIGKIYSINDRPALKLIITNNWRSLQKLEIMYPKYYTYSKLYEFIMKQNSNEGFYIHFENPYFYFDNPKGKLTSIILSINKWFEKTPFSYRLTDIKIHRREFISVTEAKDMIFYFLLSMQHFIKDFYFHFTDEVVTCVVIKK